MHQINTEHSGRLYDGAAVVDLGQTPATFAILSAADTDLSVLAQAVERSGRGAHSVRLANILSLNHPDSVELLIKQSLGHARLVVVRLLGGVNYWDYGVGRLHHLAEAHGVHLALLPGDGKPDPELDRLSTLDTAVLHRLNAYLMAGGAENATAFLDYLDDIIGGTDSATPPKPLMQAGFYWPNQKHLDKGQLRALWGSPAPVAAVVFYRAWLEAGDLAPVDGLIAALTAQGLAPLPMFVASLKDGFCADFIANMLGEFKPWVILNMTNFAVGNAAGNAAGDASGTQNPYPFGVVSVPVIQAIIASNTLAHWHENTAGLNPRDLAMSVVLPEFDGRIISRAIGFKTKPQRHPLTQALLVRYCANAERADFTARLAKAWVRLAQTPRENKRIAMILANYPNKDSRLANGVGLDTPASVCHCLRLLAESGYSVDNAPEDSARLMALMQASPTNQGIAGREVEAWLSLAQYQQYYQSLSEPIREAVEDRWGSPDSDPMLGEMGEGNLGFALPVRLFGNVAVAIQPARGYNIDPKASYHAPDLPPPHHYLAFYFWLRHEFSALAVIHMGKHGNLEWLPGKALALSQDCFPDAILGAMPHLYPFIVNDPGEGSQAKRRTSAVILDHLTPPMTLADSHGVMAELEALMDEYAQAQGLDSMRASLLMEDIVLTAGRAGLAADCGIDEGDSATEKLLKLDNFLCDVKEMQIRDGLHIFGCSPEGRLREDLILSILRIPRGTGDGHNASILRSLATDLGLGDFDPLTAERGEAWRGTRPDPLKKYGTGVGGTGVWRHTGDTVERLNLLAADLIAGTTTPDPAWQATTAIITKALPQIQSALDNCGVDEARFLLLGLDGGFIPPAPSGAPTRGRIEVLPTGRNFYAVDSRAVPTAAAWRIGWASAAALLDRIIADGGAFPKAIVLSVWGTANMRTGGDDIAQALALMGVQPEWDSITQRVTGFEVLPLSLLARPRVDVSLRCSGFFRDAFPSQIALIDKAARTVGALDESAEDNPIAHRMQAEKAQLLNQGIDEAAAEFMAGARVFSTKPGAYGAGLQALIDEGIWQDRGDFAESFLQWGSYAYGASAYGVEARQSFETRLGQVDAVVHNQDNREHDILDSDDYYQFAGGLASSIAWLKGSDVPIYMGDTSLAERPKIRSLGEEITRVVRGRATNPKWLKGVMRHGYKGAFEIAASLDYLFAFAATTHQVPNHLFDAVFAAWIDDAEVYDFLSTANPHALNDMLGRFNEAIDRGLWQPKRNSVIERLESFKEYNSDD